MKVKIEDLIKARSRNVHGNSYFESSSRVSDLERLFEGNKEKDNELSRYFPVATIALIESFFRAVVKEAIDKGEPYVTNSEELIKNVKFDLDTVKAFHGKEISLGEFISHQLSFSRLDHLDNTFSKLFKLNFLKELCSVHDRWAVEIERKQEAPILNDPQKVFASVSRMFEIRHIICHEWATKVDFTSSDIAIYFRDCMDFIKASHELVSNIFHPNAPLTQADMNYEAGKSLAEAQKRLEQLKYELITNLSEDRKKDFSASCEAWENYMKSWADFVANEYKGGSILPLIFASEANTIVDERIKQLQEYKKQYSSEEL